MEKDRATIRHHSGIETIRANNPSLMTGTGTNSYVLHSQGQAIVIDPGPDDPVHLSALIAAIGSHSVCAIVVTHAHLDHSALAPRLAAKITAPIVAFGGAASGRHPAIEKLIQSGMPISGEGADHAFTPDTYLKDGDNIQFGQKALRILHTPGHMGGHICLAMGDTLFSGDHVMGWSTSLIAPPDGHMGDYMSSLSRLLENKWAEILPGHGARIANPTQRLQELWNHRKSREQAILTELIKGPASPAALTETLYKTTAPALWPAAERSVISHLIDLQEKSVVSCDHSFLPHGLFRLN